MTTTILKEIISEVENLLNQNLGKCYYFFDKFENNLTTLVFEKRLIGVDAKNKIINSKNLSSIRHSNDCNYDSVIYKKNVKIIFGKPTGLRAFTIFLNQTLFF